jgi:hypothetical protein
MTKKGLFVALMTVTFAFLRVSAFAEAPLISDPGDIIIGDLENGAGSNVFVFPDAIGLDGIVSDDVEPDATIKWSWTEDGTASSRYLLNGVPPILSSEDPTNPPSNKRLDGNDDDTGSSVSQDTDARTVTFRNQGLSDILTNGGAGPYADPGTTATGILPGETRQITLYASDCSTYSSISITVYTANNTSDSVSGGGAVLIPVFDHDFDGDPSRITGWFGGVLGGTGTTGTATGLCMWVAAANTGNAGVGWISPPNFAPFPAPAYIDLIDQAVYRLRMTMYTDQTATGAIPFWTFGYNNLNGMTPPGSAPGGNSYGGDLWILDVAGGANGINGPANGRPNGRSTFDYWFTPNAVLAAQWRGTLTGALSGDNAESPFSTTYDPVNDMNLVVRILDGSNGANSIHNEVDTGTVCVKELQVDYILIPNLASRTSSPGLWPTGTAASHSGGAVSPAISTTNFGINPDTFGSGGNGSAAIDNVNNFALFNMGGPYKTGATAAQLAGGRKSIIFYDSTLVDTVNDPSFMKPLYPIFWEDNQLIQLTAGIRSGVGGGNGTTEGTDPVDTVFINFDSPTSEIGGFNFTQRSAAGNMFKAGSPRLRANTGGVSQTYTAFLSTQNATDIDLNLPTFGNANRLRGYVDFINNDTLGTATDGTDDVIVDSMQLNVIDTTGFN